MKNFLWALVVVIILGGGYLLWQNNSVVPSQTENTTPGSKSANTNTENNTSGTNVGVDVDAGLSVGAKPTIVSYTDAGFSPSSVTVKKGQTIRFVNNSSGGDTWPASAVHPTHSIYPQKSDSDCLGSSFDACRALKPGESWEFTFNSVGEWKYHDHLHPSKFGTIVVSE